MLPITAFKTKLSASINSTQANIPVLSLVTQDGTTITAANFDALTDGYVYITIEPGSPKQEVIKCTNVDTSGFLEAIRGLAFTGRTETVVAANRFAHQAGATVIISNIHYYYGNHLMDLESDQTAEGIKTFSDLPATTAGNPIADNDLARKAYVDAVAIGSVSITLNRIIVSGTAGATLAAGDLVYLDTSNNRWKLATTALTSGAAFPMGIAQGAGTNGNAISGGVLLQGLDSNQSGLTGGNPEYTTTTPGDISPTAGTVGGGTVALLVGIAASTTTLLFFPPQFTNKWRGSGSVTFENLSGEDGQFPRIRVPVLSLAQNEMIVASGAQTLESKHIRLAEGTSPSFIGDEILGIAAGSQSQFDALYIKSDGTYEKADADAVGTTPCVGLARSTTTVGLAQLLFVRGVVTNAAWTWTIGGYIYLSGTTGGLTQTAPSGSGKVVQIVGIAISATSMYVNPSLVTVELT